MQNLKCSNLHVPAFTLSFIPALLRLFLCTRGGVPLIILSKRSWEFSFWNESMFHLRLHVMHEREREGERECLSERAITFTGRILVMRCSFQHHKPASESRRKVRSHIYFTSMLVCFKILLLCYKYYTVKEKCCCWISLEYENCQWSER